MTTGTIENAEHSRQTECSSSGCVVVRGVSCRALFFKMKSDHPSRIVSNHLK